jgi:CRP-like cAMP-binding protein
LPQANGPIHNQLLRRLSPDDLALLEPREYVVLDLRAPLEIANQRIDFVYFIESGLASVVADLPGKGAIEVGVIGREGMSGLSVVQGDTQSPFETYMQCAGAAHRIDVATLIQAQAASPALHAIFLRYSRAFSVQLANTAFANGRSKLEERLARWLLMVGDRMGSSFHITHEFLAMMLAVRRSGVTLALQMLEGNGLIRAGRGSITILDREGLIRSARGAYGLAEQEYARLLG